MAMMRDHEIVRARRTKKLPRRITGRRRLPAREFVFPEDRSYPLPDAYHATLALGALLRIAGRHGVDEGSRERARRVLAAVRRRFPSVYRGETDIVQKVRRVYFGGSRSREETVGRRSAQVSDVLRRHGL